MRFFSLRIADQALGRGGATLSQVIRGWAIDLEGKTRFGAPAGFDTSYGDDRGLSSRGCAPARSHGAADTVAVTRNSPCVS